ncbi:MAG TPA: MraY family glycosyltransferase [Acidimicrobiia bacterium]|jgi:UDP-GlcNAc:undecaprenyl-phosphate GlcNAc-1-phosphate transferase
MGGYLLVGAVAAVCTFLLTFVMRWIAPRIGAMALPGPRSMHEHPIPYLGGASMFVGFLVALAVASRVPQFHEMFADNSEVVGLVLAAAVMFVAFVIDDFRDVSPPAKIAGQVLAGSVLALFGVTMLYFRVPFASYEYVVLSTDLAPLVTVLTVVVLANAVNLIDGIDGLAAGVVLIAAAAIFLYADRLFKSGLLEGSNIAPLVAAITVGICAGFLPHNFSPARIIMGDAGAMLLGLFLATMTITIGGRTTDPFSGQTYFYFAPLLIPLVILGVPIVDAAFAFLRRVVRRQHFAAADREHLHHRLVRMGHGPRRAVVILWLWTALLSTVVLLPTFTHRGNTLVAPAVIALALLLYIYFHPGVRTARQEAAAGGAAGLSAASEEAPHDDSVVELETHRRKRASG